MTVAQGQFVGFNTEGLWPTSLGLAFSRGSFLKAFDVQVVTFTAASVAAASIAEQAVTVTSYGISDLVIAKSPGAPTANVGEMGTARVTATGTLQLRFINPTAGALTPPASATYFLIAFQVR